jgi:hypothetical protein
VDGPLTLAGSEAVAAFEHTFAERARSELGDRLQLAEAAVLDRSPVADSRPALAGWWCPPGDGGGLLVLPNPWDEPEAIIQHESYCWELSGALLEHIAAALNERHGVEHGTDYWDLMLRPLLIYALSALIDRRLYCVTLSRLAPELPVAAGPQVPVPATTVAATEVLRSDLGNQALSSLLGARLGLRLEPLAQADPPAVQGAPPRSSLPARALIALELAGRLAVQAVTSRRAGRRIALVRLPGLSPLGALRLCGRVPGLRTAPGPRVGAVEPSGPVDGSLRERLAALPGADERSAALAAGACALLPRTFVEDYPELVERSLAAYGHDCPAVVGNYGPHDVENEFLGRCADAGRPLAFSQHGGTYLQARVNPQERLERRPGSVFLSWGGTGSGVRPLPSPYLSELRDRHRGGERVLLVEGITPPDAYLIRFTTTPQGNQGYRHGEQLAEFARSVVGVKPRLFLKRFPAFIGGAERDPVLAGLPHRPPATQRTAARLMMTSGVVVVPYPDTPFIESLVIGAPTVGIWEDRLWKMRDDAEAPFEALRAAGVVFSDARAAAAHVDRVYDRADEWWRSAEVQAARRAFLERFALTGDWLAEWSAFFPGRWLTSAA